MNKNKKKVEVSKDTVTKTPYRHPWEVEGSPIPTGERLMPIPSYEPKAIKPEFVPPQEEVYPLDKTALEAGIRRAANSFGGKEKVEYLNAIIDTAFEIRDKLPKRYFET